MSKLTSKEKYTIVKRTFANGVVKYRVGFGTSYNRYTYDWSNFVWICERDTIESARESLNMLLGNELVSEEIVK